MISLLRSAEALSLDEEVDRAWKLEAGILMESAAQRLARVVIGEIGLPRSRPLRKMVAVIGTGNNGGDALALIRNLAFAGYRDLVVLVPNRELKSLPARKAISIAAGGIPLLHWDSPEGRQALASADLIIDGIAGTGLSGPLSGELADFVMAINDAGPEVFSIDLPSGLRDEASPEEPRIRASVTLSIEPRKLCLYAPSLRPFAGRIIPIDGVFPQDRCTPELSWPVQHEGEKATACLLGSADIPGLCGQPSAWTHKGGRGRLAIFAGSPGMAGALFLAARAAQAAGVGLVTLYVRDELFESLRAAAPEFIGGAILRPESKYREELSRHDAVLAGPGWGRDASREPILSFLLDSTIPLVLDADALRIYSEVPRGSRRAALILTPHPGEFEALSGLSSLLALASPQRSLAELSRRSGACVALKTATTWLMAPDGRLRVVDGGEAGLAVAGSGDVLAGLVAGLAAGYATRETPLPIEDAFGALCLAVLVHLEAGRSLRKAEGWFEASRLVRKAAEILGRPRKG